MNYPEKCEGDKDSITKRTAKKKKVKRNKKKSKDEEEQEEKLQVEKKKKKEEEEEEEEEEKEEEKNWVKSNTHQIDKDEQFETNRDAPHKSEKSLWHLGTSLASTESITHPVYTTPNLHGGASSRQVKSPTITFKCPSPSVNQALDDNNKMATLHKAARSVSSDKS
ncbi:hypothetical protein M8J77_017527 [Diaphorina citri]|nr:hypothetical protein M8J77_017527 [Diaphorina citri]